MHSLPSLAACFAVACVLIGCGTSSSPPPPTDSGVSETSTDASEDTNMVIVDAGEAGPPMCKDGCPKTAPTCCENGLSPNLGLCYNTTNTAFCANEGGAP
jgi:hypothetical protein